MRGTRVVLADDHDAVRRALVDVLAAAGGFEVVAELTDGRRLVDTVVATGADLVLLDVGMAGGGRAAATALAALTPAPVVVVVSATDDHETVTGLLAAGVTGYFVKGALGDTFVDDLARCARGEVVLALPRAARALRHAVSR